MHRQEVGALILTHGDRDFGSAVESVEPICDQIVVVNDANNPSNIGIIPELGDRLTVVDREFDISGRQRNAGLDRMVGAWVLLVDSDEIVPTELRREIQELEPTPEQNIFAINRYAQRGDKIVDTPDPESPHPRLFRSHFRYSTERRAHVEFEGQSDEDLHELGAFFLHSRHDGVLETIRRNFRYGLRESSFRQAQGEEFTWMQLAKLLPGDLLKRRYAMYGREGLLLALGNVAFHLGTIVGPREGLSLRDRSTMSHERT